MPTATLAGDPSPSATASQTDAASVTPSATVAHPASPTVTVPPTASASPSAHPSATPPAAHGPPPPVRINEIAWAGTLASAFDEWIELANYSNAPVDLTGWRLTDDGDIDVQLRGTIGAHGYFLLERTDDTTVSDVAAGLIYTGGLSNAGETLTLLDVDGITADTANRPGGGWPAGDAASRGSMIRIADSDSPSSWTTAASAGAAHDAAGNPILGSPGASMATAAPTATVSPVPLATPSPTSTTSQPGEPGSILINEVAWSGTRASASDEWIELYNASGVAIVLDGWRLTDGGDIDIPLSGTLASGAYLLLERTDDTSVVDIRASIIYTGGLSNGGESLTLLDATGTTIDTANPNGGHWPGGEADPRLSMERRSGGDWGTFTGYFGLGHDADGHPIGGTPGGPNSVTFPTPTPTWIPGALVINEVLPRPHYDWEGTGGVSVSDEFIELYNRGPGDVFLKGWWLDDAEGVGSRPHDLPAVTLEAGELIVLFRSKIHIGLNDGGDTVRLLDPSGRVVDQIVYLRVRAYNLSYGRLPDGSNRFAYGLWPTPGEPNILFVEPSLGPTQAPALAPQSCPAGGVPWPRLARQAIRPSVVRLWWFWGLGVCR
jgi:hypothetical protein